MKPLLNKKIITAFATTLASLGFSSWLLWQVPNKQNTANYWVKHTNLVLTRLETTLSVIKDAETGQRGYLITGDKSYLRPDNQALAEIDGYIEQLQKLTADNPNQRRRVIILKRQVGAKLSELKQTIELRQKKGFDAASQVVLTALSQGEGQGATFTVNLPLIPSAYNVPSNLPLQSVPSLEGIKILVVDDESHTRELLSFTLKQYKANVTVVASASDALVIFPQYSQIYY